MNRLLRPPYPAVLVATTFLAVSASTSALAADTARGLDIYWIDVEGGLPPSS